MDRMVVAMDYTTPSRYMAPPLKSEASTGDIYARRNFIGLGVDIICNYSVDR